MHSVALSFGLADAFSGVAACFQHCSECRLQEPSGRMLAPARFHPACGARLESGALALQLKLQTNLACRNVDMRLIALCTTCIAHLLHRFLEAKLARSRLAAGLSIHVLGDDMRRQTQDASWP